MSGSSLGALGRRTRLGPIKGDLHAQTLARSQERTDAGAPSCVE
jgi:hypothetical protein